MKKLFTPIPAALMLSALLAGCGGKTETPTSTTPEGPPKQQAEELKGPEKTVEFVVFMGAGGDTDFNARAYTQYLPDILGKDVIVTNIAGSGGALGSEEAKNADPDGYRFLFGHTCFTLNQVTGITDYGVDAFEVVCCAGVSAGEVFVGTVQDYVVTGEFKYLATTATERLPFLPDIPTCVEQGMDALVYDLTYDVLAPKGTPGEICDKLCSAMKQISEMPEYAQYIKDGYNQTVHFLKRAEAESFIQAGYEKMSVYSDYFQ